MKIVWRILELILIGGALLWIGYFAFLFTYIV